MSVSELLKSYQLLIASQTKKIAELKRIRCEEAEERKQEKKGHMYAEPCQNLIEFEDEANVGQERKVLFESQKESSMEAVQNLFPLKPERTSVVSDQHFRESVIELAVSRDTPLTVSATIPVQPEIVSGASGGIESGKDSYVQMSLTAPKVSVTSSTTANEGVDPGLLCSSLQPKSEEKKEAKESSLLREHSKRRFEEEVVYKDPMYLEQMAYSYIAQAASTELVVVPDFAGDKQQFEYWLQQVQFYLTSTRLIDGSEEVLKHFLLSHLKPGSPPAVIISTERKKKK